MIGLPQPNFATGVAVGVLAGIGILTIGFIFFCWASTRND